MKENNPPLYQNARPTFTLSHDAREQVDRDMAACVSLGVDYWKTDTHITKDGRKLCNDKEPALPSRTIAWPVDGWHVLISCRRCYSKACEMTTRARGRR